MNEKKRKILIAAMKLFSKTSFHQTSMQQIADVCGVSKGSLYTHFKSKEELLSDIFTYYYQLLSDKVAASETKGDTAQEALIRKISIHIGHYCEFQEFFQMQMNEIKGLDDRSLNQYVHQENAKLLRKIEKGILSVFGVEIAPYAADLTITLKGILMSYMRSILENGKACDFNGLAHFLFLQLQAVAQMVMEKKNDPFFVTSPWQAHLKDWQEETTHPLQIVRKLKEAMTNEEDITIESVEILEKELMEMSPRAAVLSGMIRNLKESVSLVDLANELENTIDRMPVTTLIK